MILRKVVCLVIAAAFCVPSGISSEPWAIRDDGVGPTKVGMTLAQMNKALREHFSLPKDEEHCTYMGTAKHPKIGFMISDGIFVRADIDDAGIFTTDGVQVGDSEEHVLKVYGSRAKVEPHFYTGPEDHYLTVQSKDGKYGIRFETFEGKIQRYYAGSYEAIQYVEGCS